MKMLTHAEFYIWFLLPTVISIAIVFHSVLQSLYKKSILNWAFTLIIFAAVSFSEFMICVIFFAGAWPTVVPHIIIGLSVLLFSIQILINRKAKTHFEKNDHKK